MNAWLDAQLNGNTLDEEAIIQTAYVKRNSDNNRFYDIDNMASKGPVTQYTQKQIQETAKQLINNAGYTSICRNTGIRLRHDISEEEDMSPNQRENIRGVAACNRKTTQRTEDTVRRSRRQMQFSPVKTNRPCSQVIDISRSRFDNDIESMLDPQDIYSDEYETDEIEEFYEQSRQRDNNKQQFTENNAFVCRLSCREEPEPRYHTDWSLSPDRGRWAQQRQMPYTRRQRNLFREQEDHPLRRKPRERLGQIYEFSSDSFLSCDFLFVLVPAAFEKLTMSRASLSSVCNRSVASSENI